MLGVGVLLLIAAASAVWWSDRSESPGGTKTESAPVSHERPRPKTDGAAAQQERGNLEAPVEDPAVKGKREEAKRITLDAIGEAATTYEAAQLPFLNNYLYDKDPDIRKAAREAMLVLGDAGAGKYLREASLTAASEPEREALVKAADYAELPAVDLKTMIQQQKLQGKIVKEPGTAREPRNRSVGKKRPEEGTPSAPPAPASPAPAPAPGQ